MENWIKVEDRLPQDSVMVLGLAKLADMKADRYVFALTEGNPAVWRTLFEADVGNSGVYASFPLFDDETITHWMPLPELPGKEGELRVRRSVTGGFSLSQQQLDDDIINKHIDPERDQDGGRLVPPEIAAEIKRLLSDKENDNG